MSACHVNTPLTENCTGTNSPSLVHWLHYKDTFPLVVAVANAAAVKVVAHLRPQDVSFLVFVAVPTYHTVPLRRIFDNNPVGSEDVNDEDLYVDSLQTLRMLDKRINVP
ncbi:hypothetical protein PIB30_048936 [Stylosanthes scabra]|uniref:Uncharacterized protein n=1 Tax=Stylosanthes scabra TaxID=79078 RepID=A0ABU6YEK4_9FABA|nr:hypothetical protein [Stylosanthes scabra]